jgi:hypothetical protein
MLYSAYKRIFGENNVEFQGNLVEIFFCFATFVVQNLATHKTEKQRGKNSLTTRIALPQYLYLVCCVTYVP